MYAGNQIDFYTRVRELALAERPFRRHQTSAQPSADHRRKPDGRGWKRPGVKNVFRMADLLVPGF